MRNHSILHKVLLVLGKMVPICDIWQDNVVICIKRKSQNKQKIEKEINLNKEFSRD